MCGQSTENRLGGLWCGPCALEEDGSSLAGLVDVLVDVVGRRQLLHRGYGLRVSHLSRGRGEVLIALRSTSTQGKFGLKLHSRNQKLHTFPFPSEVRFINIYNIGLVHESGHLVIFYLNTVTVTSVHICRPLYASKHRLVFDSIAKHVCTGVKIKKRTNSIMSVSVPHLLNASSTVIIEEPTGTGSEY